jgi:lipid A 3-O-deacylase
VKTFFKFLSKVVSSGLAVLTTIAGVAMLAGLSSAPALADDPDFLSVGAGYFDFNRQKDKGAEFRLEYRSSKKLWVFKPFAAAAYTSPGHGFVGAGVLIDIFLGRRVVLTPSFAPHLYWGGNDDLDLGHVVEFRSQLEVAYRFDNRSRLGLAISHYSNASLADANPGTETITLYYSLPLDNLFGK